MEVDSIKVFRPASGDWVTADSVNALDLVQVKGRVLQSGGSIDTSFNGTARIRLFDKPQERSMLDNDNVGYDASYLFRNQLAYQGFVDVVKGSFAAEWRMPLDLVLEWGQGKILPYAYTADRMPQAPTAKFSWATWPRTPRPTSRVQPYKSIWTIPPLLAEELPGLIPWVWFGLRTPTESMPLVQALVMI